MKAVPWLKRLVAGLSPRKAGFGFWSVHVGFVVDKVALGQVFLRVLWFSPVNISFRQGSILIYHLGEEQYVRWWPQFRDIVSPHRRGNRYEIQEQNEVPVWYTGI
jgi:hypothetical protein